MAEKKHTEDTKKITETKRKAKKSVTKQVEKLTKEIEIYEVKLEECEDKFLRLAADYDNYKKRTAREFDEVVTRANEDLISKLIPVLDNFERALTAATSSNDFDSFYKGIDMMYQQLKDLLEKQGVRVIKAVNEPFDPHKHEAVMVVEKEDVPPETVVEEMERGYMFNDRVLRPSKVTVSR